MNWFYWFVTLTLRFVTRLLCRIDGTDLHKVPHTGPLIVAANHINSLEVPVLFTHLMPRPITGFAKAESWNSPIHRWLFNLWGAIPLRRGEADTTAFRLALQALSENKILAIAPEGTRSQDGRLKRGLPGVALLTLRSGAPILPLVYWGGENFRANLRRFRRTDFHIRVGEPFEVVTGGQKITAELRQAITDEIMLHLAELLPPQYHGIYADQLPAVYTYTRPVVLESASVSQALVEQV